MKIKVIIFTLSSFVAPAAFGQLHESIKVDGKYVPDVIRIDRINAFPKALKSTVANTPINYEEKGVAASFYPSLVTLPATGWQTDREISTKRGYLEFGVGSFLNSTLSAGYRFVDNSSTLFGLRLQHNSTSLWKPEISEATSGVEQYRYDESAALYASHVFKGYGRLDAALDYHLGYFNYYGCDKPLVAPDNTSENSPSGVKVPGQTINDVALRIDWRSLVRPSTNLVWSLSARMRHFAYRQLMLPGYESEKGSRETNVGFEGGVRLPWDNGSSIGLDANLDIVGISQKNLDNYGMLTLTPYYRFTKGKLDVRLGADVDLSFRAGMEGHRYSFLHVAPDVRFGLQTGKVGVYLDILGGSQLNTLAHLHQLDYYGLPALTTTSPTFSPLDAAFGINLGPFSGFSMGVKGRYKVDNKVPLGGWYMTWLNYGVNPVEGMLPQVSSRTEMDYCGNSEGINLHGYSVSGYMRYEYGKVFSASVEGSCQPQRGKKGFFNGYDRPQVTGSFKVSFRPVEPFNVGISYDYRGKRKIYTSSTDMPDDSSVVINGDSRSLYYLPLPDLTLLNLSLTWSFNKNFAVWVQADNLLNKHDAYLPMQPMQGLVVVGGLKLLF